MNTKFTLINSMLALALLAGCGEAEQAADPAPQNEAPAAEAPAAEDAAHGHALTFTDAQEAYVANYMAQVTEGPFDMERMITEPSGLSHEEMASVFAHPKLGFRGLEVMVDVMKPEGSMYFDAIFGANYGQHDIRNWLVPTMAESSFLQFRPTGPAVFMDDGEGGTTIDEWIMVADFGEQEIYMGHGISVRRFRDGWMIDSMDVYDANLSRNPPPADAMAMMEAIGPAAAEMPPLPPYPVMNFQPVELAEEPPLTEAAQSWIAERKAARAAGGTSTTTPTGLSNDELYSVHNAHVSAAEHYSLIADMMHPTDSVYIDPMFGEIKGQDNIRAWLDDVMPKMGNMLFEPIAQRVWNGETSLQMFRQMAVQPDGSKTEVTWGFAVRKYKDGWLVYAADYYDVTPLTLPEIGAAAAAAGWTLTEADIMKYRAAQ